MTLLRLEMEALCWQLFHPILCGTKPKAILSQTEIPMWAHKRWPRGVFGRLGQEWETFTLTDQTLYAVGENMVLATGRYEGTHATTGKSINAQHAHIWWFEDGKVTRFQQYVDTKQLADAEMK
jgi:ketosteroid isomerase-like protein